jgi:hypothetical protein
MIIVNHRYRVCAKCGVIAGTRAFYARRQRTGGVGYDSYCKPCRRARARENHAAVMADPERRERQRKVAREHKRERWATDAAYREAEKQRHREWYASLPEQRRVEMLQDCRIRSRLARERKGLPVGGKQRPDVPGAYSPHNHPGRLEIAPLLEVVPGDFYGPHGTGLARALARLRNGESRHTTLAVADRALVALDKPYLLGVIYPDV